MGLVRKNCKVVSFTPTLSLTAYSAGDQMGSPIELEGVFDNTLGTCMLENIVITDAISQSANIDLYFFGDEPTPSSSDNGTCNIPDADVASMLLGVISLTSYKTLALNSSATLANVGLRLQHLNKNKPRSLWVVMVCRATPTYTGVDNLTVKLGISQD